MKDEILSMINKKGDIPGFDPALYTQNLLDDFSGALSQATKDGYVLDEVFTVGNWELIVGPPKEEGLLPAVYHAVFKGWGQ